MKPIVTGLPEGEKEAAAQLATSKDKEGLAHNTGLSSYIPFMKYATN